jgi:hypothetical protein
MGKIVTAKHVKMEKKRSLLVRALYVLPRSKLNQPIPFFVANGAI